jgi:hypothetical protein
MPDQLYAPLTLQWNQLALDAIQYTKTSPPLAARALAMLHTAMYDAWSVYHPNAISTTTALYIKAKPGQCNKDNTRMAFSFAAYRVLTELFWLALRPENKHMFRDWMCDCGYNPDDTTLDINTPQGIGNLAARLAIEYRNGDGANQHATLHAPVWSDYTGYSPVNTPDVMHDVSYWQPLKTVTASQHSVQSFLAPHWGLVQPFSLPYNWKYRPEPPFRKHQPEFKQQAKEALDLSAALTDEQKIIAEYWADGTGTYTPPGHWCEITQFVARTNGYRNSQCIKLFFAVANALHNAAVACWECKRYYNSARPITVIRELYKGLEVHAWAAPYKGTQTIKGEQWLSYIPTPPFPEHVSGHSTFSRAAAIVLQKFTGSDAFGGCITKPRGSSVIEPGVTPCKDVVLDWPTFTAAAEQAGASRLYGGIHFTRANKEGQQLGLAVGISAWEKALFYFNEPSTL